MANRRMFSIAVVETDRFLDMPTSAQCLYFHLGMHGDDDGFVASPKRITSLCGCNPDDLRLLISKGFIYPFDTGVCVIKDWRLNNTLKNDRYHPTIYTDEKHLLEASNETWFQIGSKMEPEHNITKHNITKHSCNADKPQKTKFFVPPSVEEVRQYCENRHNGIDPQRFIDFYEARGWMLGKNKMRDWKAAVRTWEQRDNKTDSQRRSSAELFDAKKYDAEMFGGDLQ